MKERRLLAARVVMLMLGFVFIEIVVAEGGGGRER